MRLLKIVLFRLKLGFFRIYLPIFFSRTIRNLDVISWGKRYIRIFDVIPELYSVSPRRMRRFKKRSHLGQHAISEVWDVTTNWIFKKPKGSPLLQFQKVWAFWALDMAPTLDVPVLLLSWLLAIISISSSLLKLHKTIESMDYYNNNNDSIYQRA